MSEAPAFTAAARNLSNILGSMAVHCSPCSERQSRCGLIRRPDRGYRQGVRPARATVLSALLAAIGCDCDGGLTMVGQDTGVKPRCTMDSDCEEREACNVAVGICYPLDECDDMRPCEMANQICEDRNGDGFLECVFMRCEEDEECVAAITCDDGLVPTCSSGGCICGQPCNGGCPGGQGCCVPTNVCHDLPPQCEGVMCPPGQFVSVTSTGAWDTGQCEFSGEL